jgi:DnaJ-class molecular chaperone
VEFLTWRRIVTCRCCAGDGCFDETYIQCDHAVGNHHSLCPCCDGKGEIEIEVEPITLDDLEAMTP